MAVRGSDNPYDFITNAGIFEGVTPEQTSQYQELKVLIDGWLGDGTLEPGFTISGSAMAAYDVPMDSGNVIPQDVKDNLQPVIANSWSSST